MKERALREEHVRKEAFVEIYNSTYDNTLKYVVSKCGNAEDVSDIMQNIYLKLYTYFEKGRKIERPRDYVFGIAKNELKKYYHFKDGQKQNIPAFSEKDDNIELEALESVLTMEIPESSDVDMDDIWRYIKGLDAVTYKIFVLHFHYDEKLVNIAKMLDMGESAVRVRLCRALKQMREKFNLS